MEIHHQHPSPIRPDSPRPARVATPPQQTTGRTGHYIISMALRQPQAEADHLRSCRLSPEERESHRLRPGKNYAAWGLPARSKSDLSHGALRGARLGPAADGTYTGNLRRPPPAVRKCCLLEVFAPRNLAHGDARAANTPGE